MSNFFSTVATFATPFAKSAKAAHDPLAIAKVKFATVCDAQVKLLKDGKEKGYCFKRHGDGAVVTLKNGATMLNAAAPSFAVGTVADACKFFEQAKAAAQAGEFDELFKATARKLKEKAVAVEADAAATVVATDGVQVEPAADAALAAATRAKRK